MLLVVRLKVVAGQLAEIELVATSSRAEGLIIASSLWMSAVAAGAGAVPARRIREETFR